MEHLFSVPCLCRAASVEEEYEASGGEVLVDNEDNEGWLATHGEPKGMFDYGSLIICNYDWPVFNIMLYVD